MVLSGCGATASPDDVVKKFSDDTLLQEGEYTQSEKKLKRKLDVLSSAYWCTTTAIYLGWSF